MNNDNSLKKVYLNQLQVLIFMHKLAEIKKDNSNIFNDEIVKVFESLVFKRFAELASVRRTALTKLNPNYDKIVITRNMYNYLCRLTGVYPLDEDTMKNYAPIIAGKVQEATDKRL
ncbi:MAG TPA: hypothetical protein PLX66_02230 [Bacilli bacterium]|nr:hypothetical protein [Bacilli bacterium]